MTNRRSQVADPVGAAGADLNGTKAPTPDATSPGDEAPSAARVRALAEATLVSRAQDGDAGAFERLVRAYERELVRLGYRMLSDVGEAQDAAQDTFVLAWRKLPSLVDPRAFHAWVYQLMTRRCLNLLRARARRRTSLGPQADLAAEASPGPAADADTGPASTAQATALRDGLTAALATLTADQRACWVLNEMHDLSYPEIGYAIGIPVSTVRGRIARARQHLAKELIAWQ